MRGCGRYAGALFFFFFAQVSVTVKAREMLRIISIVRRGKTAVIQFYFVVRRVYREEKE